MKFIRQFMDFYKRDNPKVQTLLDVLEDNELVFSYSLMNVDSRNLCEDPGALGKYKNGVGYYLVPNMKNPNFNIVRIRIDLTHMEDNPFIDSLTDILLASLYSDSQRSGYAVPEAPPQRTGSISSELTTVNMIRLVKSNPVFNRIHQLTEFAPVFLIKVIPHHHAEDKRKHLIIDFTHSDNINYK